MISNNEFLNNIAYSEGGVIKWINWEPIIENNNNFINNTAIYGNINATFPFKIDIEYDSKLKICPNNSNFCYFKIGNLASGANLNFHLSFSIKDIYNRTILSLNHGYLTIKF